MLEGQAAFGDAAADNLSNCSRSLGKCGKLLARMSIMEMFGKGILSLPRKPQMSDQAMFKETSYPSSSQTVRLVFQVSRYYLLKLLTGS